MPSRCRRIAALLCTLVLASAGAAHAQYPARPIKWIVPYTPGGITDSVTRLVAQKLEASLGQPIVIENKPGANSIVGAETVARSTPDGYTALTVIAAHAANATLYAGKLPFDPVKSFAPISVVASAPLMLAVNNDFPAKDMKELIAYAKANPGKISFGSSGVGAAAHLTTELLKQTADIDMVHIAYKGTAPALTALLAGDIQVLVDVPLSMLPHTRAGKIRALGIFSAKRIVGAPEVPTVAEAGGPAIEGSTWVMFLAPAGTPREIVNRLSRETARIIAAPDIRARFEQLGVEPIGGTPEEASRFLDEEIAKWAKVITTANVKLEQ
ncbi:MAG: Bug family tripartite tricarboxylate transporter substrate binding protein [Usitatibacter sp.]